MINTMKKQTPIHTTTGNVMADLGFKNADELANRVLLASQFYEIVEKRKLTQVQTTEIIGIPQSKVSLLMNGELKGFTSERLMRFIAALGHDVEICVSKKYKPKGGSVNVYAGL